MTPRHTHNRDGRPYPPKLQRQINGLSDGAAYAYGFSDQKPGWTYWLVQIIVIIGAITAVLGLWGCEPKPADRKQHALYPYVQDPVTGICFAEYSSNSFSYVPCTEAVLKEIR